MLRRGLASSRLLTIDGLALRAHLHVPSAAILSGPASRQALPCAPSRNASPYTCEEPHLRLRHIRELHLSPTAGRFGHPHAHTLPLAYKERNIVINTCGPLYKKWRAERRHGYKHAPEAGTEVPIDYVHTGMDRAEHKDRSERPLAMILTGAPGSYQDYSYTIPFLDRHGVDVICPKWPDFKFTLQNYYWWHTSDEKTCLVVDLLKQLDIKTIDMLVCHSSASFPAMQLAADVPEVEVKSMALLMPCKGTDIRATRNPFVNPYLHWLLKVPGIIPFLTQPVKLALAIIRHPLKRQRDDVFFSYFSTRGVDNERYNRQMAKVLHSRLPMVVMISDTDKLISVEDNHEFLLKLGCDPKKTWLYDGEGQLVSRGEYGVIKVIELLKGSHYGFSRHSEICNKELLELLARVNPYPNRFHR